jgi:hypothetical protein
LERQSSQEIGACRDRSQHGNLDGEDGLLTGKNSTYMDYYDVEVGMIDVNDVVTNDMGDGKNQMIDVKMELQHCSSVAKKMSSVFGIQDLL